MVYNVGALMDVRWDITTSELMYIHWSLWSIPGLSGPRVKNVQMEITKSHNQ